MPKRLTSSQRVNIYGTFAKSISQGVKLGNKMRDAKTLRPKGKAR